MVIVYYTKKVEDRCAWGSASHYRPGIEGSKIFRDNTDRNNFLDPHGGIVKETKENDYKPIEP